MDTPTTLEMEEGDTIEVYQQQTGGGLCWDLRLSFNSLKMDLIKKFLFQCLL